MQDRLHYTTSQVYAACGGASRTGVEHSVDLKEIEQALRAAGLTPRGAFHPEGSDGVPEVAAGTAAHTLVLAGNAGEQMWHAFEAARAGTALTLDLWSRRVLEPLAAQFGARALFPFERPYLPFQRWAMRAEACHPSPLGLLIHPDYGLWHGYRGALVFADVIALPPPDRRPSPCASCADRPCLAACPANAFAHGSYDVPACARYLAAAPQSDCMNSGCGARLACPVGRSYRYPQPQARFHMEAFLSLHTPRPT